MPDVAIVGATGYVGGELARLLLRHRHARLAAAVARSHVGDPLSAVHPHLRAAMSLPRISEDVGDAEVIFSAMPPGEAARRAPTWLREGRTVIDIGSDFRLEDPSLYPRWYGYEHPAPELLAKAVYGLTERARPRLRGAKLVANPGCYPTAALLALAPAVEGGLLTDGIVVDAKSGVSGAGHSLDEAYLFGTVNESLRPYGLPRHRHTPEIAQEIDRISGRHQRVTFVPHLVPMTRGLVATCYADLRPGTSSADVTAAYERAYGAERFVRVVEAPPSTKATLGSNLCLVHVSVDEAGGRLVAIAAIDNLVKGAAGSAIQNMNAVCGLPEEEGLDVAAMWP
jgi:N-acetyl-gamma-glutamyl-phosphate reductase